MTVMLTPAARRHATPIAGILGHWRQEAGWIPSESTPHQDRAAARLLLRRTEVTLARRRFRVLGFIALSGKIVQALYLAPEAVGQGLGRSLIEHAKARTDRLELWTHQANSAARGFYVKQGFYEKRLTNGEDNDDRLPDVHLVWARGTA